MCRRRRWRIMFLVVVGMRRRGGIEGLFVFEGATLNNRS
jgi:hypothetical protein